MDAYSEGFAAYPVARLIDNPYPRPDERHELWEQGWKAAWFTEYGVSR